MVDNRLNGHDQYTPPRRLLGPDGLPITSERYGGDGYPLPHVIQMGAIAQSGWEVYWDRWDEARRHSRENALAMEKDCFLQALLQERALATSTLKWHVHADDEKDPYQKALKDGMQRVLSCTPHKTRLNYQTLKNGMWYGRGASQLVWEWREISVPVVKAMPVTPPGVMPPGQGKDAGAGINTPARGEEAGEELQPFLRDRHLAPPQDDPFAGGLPGNPAGTPAAVTVADERRRSLCVKRHQPVHGDSIYHKWDGTPVVLTYAPAQRDVAGSRMTWTTAGSIATVLSGTWRERFIVYSHESKPAEFFDYEKAEAIHGSGLRDVLYWSWWMKSEYLEWITTFYERFGLGLRLWGYEAGNKASYDEVFALATASSRRVNVMVPIFGGKSGQQQVGGLTAVETPVSGAEAVRTMLEYFDAQMERYVVGQSMSGGADSESGLGGTGRAKFAANTKYQLVKYDAENLADCYTSDWLRVSQRWTYPEARDVPLEFRFNVPDPDNQEKLEGVEKAISFGVDFKKDEVRGLTGMSDPQPGDDIVGGADYLAAEQAADAAGDKPPGEEEEDRAADEDVGLEPPSELEPQRMRRRGPVGRHVTDASGHEHAPGGNPEGGQFTKGGGPHMEKLKGAHAAHAKAKEEFRAARREAYQGAATKAKEALAKADAHAEAAGEHMNNLAFDSDTDMEEGEAFGALESAIGAYDPGESAAVRYEQLQGIEAAAKEALAVEQKVAGPDYERHGAEINAAHERLQAFEQQAAAAAARAKAERDPAKQAEYVKAVGEKLAALGNPLTVQPDPQMGAVVAGDMGPHVEAENAKLAASGNPHWLSLRGGMVAQERDEAYEEEQGGISSEDAAANKERLGAIVKGARAGREALREAVAHRRKMGAVKRGEAENYRLGDDDAPAPAAEKDHNVVSQALKEVGRAIGLLEHDRGMAQTRRRKVVRDEGGNIVGLVDEYPEVVRHDKTDAAGHRHKGAGFPEGGQFTGGGGASTEVVKEGQKADNGGGEKPAVGTPEAHATAVKKAREKLTKAPVPTPEQIAAAREGMKAMGANLYRKTLIGNSTDRKRRRDKLLAEFGDGETCPCVYCGEGLTHGTLEQDKIKTTAQGGRYTIANLVPACGPCNKRRGDMPFEEAIQKVVRHAGVA